MTTIDNQITALGDLADRMTAWLKATTDAAKADEARRTTAVLDFATEIANNIEIDEPYGPNTEDCIRIHQLLPELENPVPALVQMVDELQTFRQADRDWDHNDPERVDPEPYRQMAIEIAEQAVHADRIAHYLKTPAAAVSAIEAPATAAQDPSVTA